MSSMGYRQVLDDIIAAVTGLPTTGTNVIEDQAVAVPSGAIPGIVVSLAQIQPVVLGEAQDDTWREIHTLVVDVICLANTPALRDQVTFEALDAILRVLQPGRARRYMGSLPIESGEGAKRLYSIRNRFEIEIHVYNTAPDVLITEG